MAELKCLKALMRSFLRGWVMTEDGVRVDNDLVAQAAFRRLYPKAIRLGVAGLCTDELLLPCVVATFDRKYRIYLIRIIMAQRSNNTDMSNHLVEEALQYLEPGYTAEDVFRDAQQSPYNAYTDLVLEAMRYALEEFGL